MKDYKRCIAEALLRQYNQNRDKQDEFYVFVKTICPEYVGIGHYNAEISDFFHNLVVSGIKENLWSASFNQKTQVYTKICASSCQVRAIAQLYQFRPEDDYENRMREVLSRYVHSPAPAVRKWVVGELENNMKKVRRWFRYVPDGDVPFGELNLLLANSEKIALLENDIPLRNLSSAQFYGSKDFEKNYLDKTCKVLEPDLCEKGSGVSYRDILAMYHVLSAPGQVLVRGSGVIHFQNGDTLHLASSHVALSDEYVRSISFIDGRRLLSIENLTTFHYHPVSDGEILVCTLGYPAHIVTDFIKKWLVAPGRDRFDHFGDMDGYGFDILLKLHERTGVLVAPRSMNLDVFLKNQERAVELNVANLPVFDRLLSSDYFSDEMKDFFRFLLAEGKMLEQESLIC